MPFKQKLFIITLILFLSPMTGVTPCLSGDLFYIRSDIKVINGIVKEKKLLMTPADAEYRTDIFKRYTISGTPGENPALARDIAAEHNALINLLENHGLKSVQSKTVSQKYKAYEETILSYEGLIIIPYLKRQVSYTPSGTLLVTLDIHYSPIADPSKWSYLYFKKTVVDFFDAMLSIFR